MRTYKFEAKKDEAGRIQKFKITEEWGPEQRRHRNEIWVEGREHIEALMSALVADEAPSVRGRLGDLGPLEITN